MHSMVELVPASESARPRPACRDEDPELFFPIGNSGPALKQIEEAKRVCGLCPLLEACRRWALDSDEHGVWGGLSEDERRALKRAERRRAAARRVAA